MARLTPGGNFAIVDESWDRLSLGFGRSSILSDGDLELGLSGDEELDRQRRADARLERTSIVPSSK